jgi:hypothetical protein
MQRYGAHDLFMGVVLNKKAEICCYLSSIIWRLPLWQWRKDALAG